MKTMLGRADFASDVGKRIPTQASVTRQLSLIDAVMGLFKRAASRRDFWEREIG
jgi:hypothetical protein